METRYYINAKGELVKKIGRTMFEVNGVHFVRQTRNIVLGYVNEKKRNPKQR
jgi:hypothetical protein